MTFTPQTRPAAVHAIFGVDIAGFSHPDRDDEVQLAVRSALYRILRQSWEQAGLSWAEAICEDRGDGVVLIPPSHEPPAALIDPLLGLIRGGLYHHNKLSSAAGRIRLRAALHLGVVHRDDHGLAGTAVTHMFRLLDSPALRAAVTEPGIDLAFIASHHVYDTVIRTHGSLEPDTYLPVQCQVKETLARAWITIPVRGRQPLLGRNHGTGMWPDHRTTVGVRQAAR